MKIVVKWVVCGGVAGAILAGGTPALTAPEPLKLTRHKGWVTSVPPSPEGKRLASGGSDGSINVWDRATAKRQKRLSGKDGEFGRTLPVVTSVTFSPQGTTLGAGYEDGSARIWDLASASIRHRLLG